MNKVDVDHSGTVDYKELAASLIDWCDLRTHEKKFSMWVDKVSPVVEGPFWSKCPVSQNGSRPALVCTLGFRSLFSACWVGVFHVGSDSKTDSSP